MNITQIQPRMLILEYRQEESDPDYGYCTWARFTFNLDKYELSIYPHGWISESEVQDD